MTAHRSRPRRLYTSATTFSHDQDPKATSAAEDCCYATLFLLFTQTHLHHAQTNWRQPARKEPSPGAQLPIAWTVREEFTMVGGVVLSASKAMKIPIP